MFPLRTVLSNSLASQLPAFKVLLIGLIGFIAFDVGWSRVEHMAAATLTEQRVEAPATNWVRVYALDVDDAEVGEDPQLVRVDRHFKFPGTMSMDWEVSIFRRDAVGNEQFLCAGRGFSSNYSSTSKVHTPVPVLAWWAGVKNPARSCATWPFPTGETCMRTKWTFTPKGYPEKEYSAPETCWFTKPHNPA